MNVVQTAERWPGRAGVPHTGYAREELPPHTAAQAGRQAGVMLLPGVPTLLPGTGVEVRWEIQDNAKLVRRRLPDLPGLALVVRSLSPEELAQRRPAWWRDDPPTAGATSRLPDGAVLRAARERSGVPLRRVSRVSGLSHVHLSKVERGEPQRPVTPEVVAAFR